MRALLMLASSLIVVCATGFAVAKGGGGLPPPPPVKATALTSIPVKELAIFKDGHAFVLHESEVATDGNGDVVLDTLPTPVIGTFWPYSSDPQAKFRAAVAGRRVVQTSRDALSTRELLENNPGAEVIIREADGTQYAATIIGVPKLAPAEEDVVPAADIYGQQGRVAPPVQPVSNIILLRVQEGVRVAPLERIVEVVFRTEPKATVTDEERRGLLTLKLDWEGKAVADKARIGMVYLQRGVRWIPSYQITIDGEGKAHVRLQATIINELVDLQDVTAHLVIGVPTFYFEDTIDPIALDQTVAQLSSYFQTAGGGAGGRIQSQFSNAIASQRMRMTEYRVDHAEAGPIDAIDPAIEGGSQREDLFLFQLKNLTLRKGERMVVPVAEFTLPYEDVYVLDLPFSPPAEVQPNVSGEQMNDLIAMLRTPKVIHRVRLQNNSQYPLTTAPVIILSDKRLVAQGLMTYTAIGGKSDVDLTPAVDISVTKSDVETGRKPDVMRWGGYEYGRIDLRGTICLTNRRATPVKLEVHRRILGQPTEASHDGDVSRSSLLEAEWRPGRHYPQWWYWYSWPNWWYHLNGVGKIDWDLTLKPGETVDLTYQWHYFWR